MKIKTKVSLFIGLVFAILTVFAAFSFSACTPAIASINLTPETYTLTIPHRSYMIAQGPTIQLEATVEGRGNPYQGIRWTSSNLSVAIVHDGLVTGLSEGEAVITARSDINPAVFATTQIIVENGAQPAHTAVDEPFLHGPIVGGVLAMGSWDIYELLINGDIEAGASGGMDFSYWVGLPIAKMVNTGARMSALVRSSSASWSLNQGIISFFSIAPDTAGQLLTTATARRLGNWLELVFVRDENTTLVRLAKV